MGAALSWPIVYIHTSTLELLENTLYFVYVLCCQTEKVPTAIAH